MALSDLDGNGTLDLLVAARFGDSIEVRSGLGDGTFGAQVTRLAGNSPVAMAVADFDSNGAPDLAVTHSSADETWIFLNRCTLRAEIGDAYCFGNGGDGQGCTSCPCGNDSPLSSFGGCLNSLGGSARLLAYGTPSQSADELRFELTGGAPNSFALLVSGSTSAPASPANPCFAAASGITSSVLDGLRCTAGGFLRHGVRAIDSNGEVGRSNAGFGPPDGPAGGLLSQIPTLPGQERFFQIFYRDQNHGACLQGIQTTQGLSISVLP